MADVARFLDPNLVQRLNHLQLTARRVVEGTTAGHHRSPLKGASVEFRQHRSYAAGDELRRLDWRVLARTNRPYVREFQEETNLRAVILLDRSGSMGYSSRFGTKLDYATRIAAALAYLMLGQTESVGIAVFGEQIEKWIAPAANASQLSRVIEMLEDLEPAGQSSPDAAMHEVAERVGKRSLVIVISDLFAPIERLRHGLARLRYDRHELLALQVLDPDELDFPFRANARFSGLEGESSTLCDAGLLRKTYLTNFTKHQQAIQESCRSLGARWARFVIDRPLDEALIWFLRQHAIKG